MFIITPMVQLKSHFSPTLKSNNYVLHTSVTWCKKKLQSTSKVLCFNKRKISQINNRFISCFDNATTEAVIVFCLHIWSVSCPFCVLQWKVLSFFPPLFLCRLLLKLSGAPDWLKTSSSEFEYCYIICSNPTHPQQSFNLFDC